MNIKTVCGEKVGDIVVKSSSLKSVKCPVSLVPILIDEFPNSKDYYEQTEEKIEKI